MQSPFLQDSLGEVAVVTLARFQFLEQVRDAGIDELRLRHCRVLLGSHSPDTSVNPVTTRVIEVDFPVLNDRVVPVGDVDRSIGSLLDIDRTEGHVRRLDHIGLFDRDESRALLLQDESNDAVATEVIRDQAAAPVFGQVLAVDDFQSAVLRTAGVQPLQDAGSPERRQVRRPWDDIIDPFAPGSVGRECRPEVIEHQPPRVHQPAVEDLQLECLGAELPVTASI